MVEMAKSVELRHELIKMIADARNKGQREFYIVVSPEQYDALKVDIWLRMVDVVGLIEAERLIKENSGMNIPLIFLGHEVIQEATAVNTPFLRVRNGT